MATPIEKIQTILGFTDTDVDGIWGPKSQAALNKQIGSTQASNPTLAKIQKVLGVDADGVWGPVSQEALNVARGGGAGGDGGTGGTSGDIHAEASSFADPKDVADFKACKATGKSDQACFKVGDNGIGQFGANTAQTHTPMVAIHKDDMIARWGSVNAAAHRKVVVTIRGKSVEASVEDRLGVAGRIDLNPACAKELGLTPPFLIPRKDCVWHWV
jgi:hypothetical protein